MSNDNKTIDTKGYWRSTIRLILSLLAVWFIVSYGAGILFRDFLDKLAIGGVPLGFWFSQSGAIFVFLILIFYFCRKMSAIERKYGVKD